MLIKFNKLETNPLAKDVATHNCASVQRNQTVGHSVQPIISEPDMADIQEYPLLHQDSI